MDEFDLIQGHRSASFFFHHKPTNYIYKKVSEKNDVIYLKCNKKDCPSRARFNKAESFSSSHAHSPDQSELEKLFTLKVMKERAASESTPIKDIVVQECEKAQFDSEWFQYKNIVDALNRHRAKCNQQQNDFDDSFEVARSSSNNDEKSKPILKEEFIFSEDEFASREEEMSGTSNLDSTACPVCDKHFPATDIEVHVDQCLQNTTGIDINVSPNKQKETSKRKRDVQEETSAYKSDQGSPKEVKQSKQKESWSFLTKPKKFKKHFGAKNGVVTEVAPTKPDPTEIRIETGNNDDKPLADLVRPQSFDEFLGQNSVTGETSTVKSMILGSRYCSMILWGPPGCGKTTLAHIISIHCRTSSKWKYTPMSACTSNVAEVKSAIQTAKTTKMCTNRNTIIFMDEIHRFNKAQQDVFLPHVESGLITLIGATTENPSFSLNSALLSRCRVIKLEALTPNNVFKLIVRALDRLGGRIRKLRASNCNTNCTIVSLDEDNVMANIEFDEKEEDSNQSWFEMTEEAVHWLSGGCSGDARVALNALQPIVATVISTGIDLITIDHVKEVLKDNPTLYDRKGDQHYNHASALQKSIRGSDDNAALYWTTRMLNGGEDPMFIARRLVRTAAEDIGLADPEALKVAMTALEATKNIGMPEADVILGQCAVYLARAPKNPEVYHAMQRIKSHLKSHMGELPPVPLRLCNAPTKLMKDMGYGQGYKTDPQNIQNISYMPDSLQNHNFFH